MKGERNRRWLVGVSLELIARQQAPTGAYIAAPGYDTYAYCWLRDGTFIAAAMDAHGRHDSAAAFHAWVARTIERHAHKVEALEADGAAALAATGNALHPLDDRYTLHTRFTVEGEEGDEHWGDFQLDGYGFWLTGLVRHLALTGADPAPYVTATALVRRYLGRTWELPCFDCWEEYPTQRHPTTWAAVARGLRDSSGMGEAGAFASGVADTIISRLLETTGTDHVMRKFIPDDGAGRSGPLDAGPDAPGRPALAGHERMGGPLDPNAVDGSALLVLGEFGPFGPHSAVPAATLQAIEDTLAVGGGVHRYLEDEFYGGGLWVVLGGARALLLASTAPERATDILAWVESTADQHGHLPEQVDTHLRKPSSRAAWVQRWGPPARPLLWSHAMYLLAVAGLDQAE